MSEQTQVKPCCVTGHIHTGAPLGTVHPLYGLSTYESLPKAPTDGKVDTIIFISDIFGIYPNAKLVADEWAGQGYRALLPDIFEGDYVDEGLLNTIVPNNRKKAEATALSKAADTAKAGAALSPWLAKHREAVVKPLIEKFVQAVRADPKTGKVAAIGFCWGARYALLLANEDSSARVDAAIANHPSFLTKADIESIKSVPVAFFKGTNDDMTDDKTLDEYEEVLRAKLNDKLHVQKFPGAVHGFTIRGDTEDEKEKTDKEVANSAAMAFIAKHFGRK